MENIIIDCDPGIDDVLAIILAEKSEKLRIKAITTVAGNSSINNTAINALKVLDLLGKENIPVYKGEKKPLKGRFQKGEMVHGKDGLAENSLENPSRSWEDIHAVDFLNDYIHENPKEITLVAIGPLTNIAKCIQKNPKFKEEIEKMIIMGGAIHHPGNITRTAEFNIYSDPQAAKIVFESGIKDITLVPLNVTHQTILTPKLKQKIKTGYDKEGIFFPFVHWILDFYQRFCIEHTGFEGAPLHDPLAIAEIIDSTFMKKKVLDVRVVTSSEKVRIGTNISPIELIRGQTIAELRNGDLIQSIKPNLNVCLEVDEERFLRYFINTLNS
jgi:inosine-uridine nucleoside N-ribohydrolase